MKYYGGSIGIDLGTDNEKLLGIVNLTDPDKQAASRVAKKKYLRVAMICGSKQERYANMVEELQIKFTQGNGDYSSDTTEAYNILVNYNISYKLLTILVD